MLMDEQVQKAGRMPEKPFDGRSKGAGGLRGLQSVRTGDMEIKRG